MFYLFPRSQKILDILEKCERKIGDLSSRNLVNNDQSGNVSANNPETSFTSADSASMQNGEFPFDDASLVGETGGKNDSLSRSNNNNNNNNNNKNDSLRRANDALAFWERQRRLFDRMHLTFANSDLPLAPSTVKLEIAGSESLLVNISEPRHTGGALVTTYKVEWSVSPRFDALEGEQVVGSSGWGPVVLGSNGTWVQLS